MAREPEKPAVFKHEELKLLRSTLDSYSGTITRALVYLEAKDEQEIWVFKSASLNRGLRFLRPFIASLEQSLNAAAEGKPIGENTRKSRNSE